VLYDRYEGTPPTDSPLESLFILVYVRRQEADLLATRALVRATLTKDEEDTDAAIEAFDKYCEKMFPFWKKAADTEADEEKKALLDLVKKPLRIKMAEIYKAQARTLEQRQKRSRIPDRLRMKRKP
jgi:hypothetical protein